MGFFKTGFKGSLIGAGVVGTIATVAFLFLGPAAIIPGAIGCLLGGVAGGFLGGGFGLTSDDDDKEYDRESDQRIRELEDKLKEKEQGKEKGFLGKLMGFLAAPLAILGIGAASYGGYKVYKKWDANKAEEAQNETGGAGAEAAAAAVEEEPLGRGMNPALAMNREMRLAAAGLARNNVSDARDVANDPEGIARHAVHTTAPKQAVRGQE